MLDQLASRISLALYALDCLIHSLTHHTRNPSRRS